MCLPPHLSSIDMSSCLGSPFLPPKLDVGHFLDSSPKKRCTSSSLGSRTGVWRRLEASSLCWKSSLAYACQTCLFWWSSFRSKLAPQSTIRPCAAQLIFALLLRLPANPGVQGPVLNMQCASHRPRDFAVPGLRSGQIFLRHFQTPVFCLMNLSLSVNHVTQGSRHANISFSSLDVLWSAPGPHLGCLAMSYSFLRDDAKGWSKWLHSRFWCMCWKNSWLRAVRVRDLHSASTAALALPKSVE